MKQVFCRDLIKESGKTITSFFLLASKQCRRKKNGELFLDLVLCDRSGTINAKLWSIPDGAAEVQVDSFVKVEGTVGQYQGRAELTLNRIRVVDEAEVDVADFLPTTEESVDAMWARLCEFVESVESLQIRQLLRAVLMDEEIAALFRRAPAAKSLHHAYLGGLLEHVLSLCRLCDLASQNYPWLNRDILLGGAVLHDIGKIQELGFRRSFNYTDQGQLMGHIALGVQILKAKAEEVGSVPAAVLALLQHMVLSHHGELQFGSPVQPALAEALLFHYLDNADSKLAAVKEALAAADEGSMWTDRLPSLGRRVIRTKAFLAGDSAAKEDEPAD